MITSSDIHKYHIALYWNHFSKIDDLFSGLSYYNEETGESRLDPCISADNNAGDMGIEFYDITVAIGLDGTCQIQTIVFRTKEGRDRYIEDGKVVFNPEVY